MKKGLLFISLVVLIVKAYGQDFSSDFKTIVINKKVHDFPDKFDLSSPLSAFITFRYTLLNGRNNLLRQICSVSKQSEIPDSISEVPNDEKSIYLNARINEIHIYKDSIAFVISKYEGGDYSIRIFYLELGKWLNVAEERRSHIEAARQFIKNRIEVIYDEYLEIYANFLTPSKKEE
jgi:hypothetical protein